LQADLFFIIIGVYLGFIRIRTHEARVLAALLLTSYFKFTEQLSPTLVYLHQTIEYMIAHHVLFWLKADTSDEQKIAFRKSLSTLEKIEVVKFFHVGTPAPIERAVVDTTYSFSLFLAFEDMTAHDVYQVHALHQAFLEEFVVFFDKVIIYDAE
jgi:hypothetical protein